MTEYMRHLGFNMPGGWEWLIILIVALLIFGKRLPDIARSLGKSLTEFKKGINEAKDAGDELVNNVKKAKDDVVNQAKNASGIDELNR